MNVRLVRVPGRVDNQTFSVALAYLTGIRKNAKCLCYIQKPDTPDERCFVSVYSRDNFSSEPDFVSEHVGIGRFVIQYGDSVDPKVFDKLEKGVKFRHLYGFIGALLDAGYWALDKYLEYFDSGSLARRVQDVEQECFGDVI